ncbi:MAG: PKD domain-containing protein [Fervidobacterium sp.]
MKTLKEQKFNLNYDLINLTDDVVQARVELYRYLDEDAMNGGWKLEKTLNFSPPFSSSIPISFEDLKKGKTYSITLIVTTDMPNILLQDGSPPIDITIKTVYFLWPKENGMHLSATTDYEGEPRRQHFKLKWSSASGSTKTKIKAHHSNNQDNPIIESEPEGEMTFSREEVWTWPLEDLTSISVDAIDSNGNLIKTTSFVIGSDPPRLDAKALPCIPPPTNPSDPEVSDSNDKIIDDGIIKAVISYKYGGAFFALRLKSFTDPNNSNLPFNLINNVGKNGYGIDGLLCQTAITRKNDKWPEKDSTAETMERFDDQNNPGCKIWENDPCGRYAPACMDDRDNQKYFYHLILNQAGPQPGCFGTISDNMDEWNVDLKDHSGSSSNGGKTMAPTYTNPSLGTRSPVRYKTLADYWLPYDNLPTSPYNFKGQPRAAMDSTVELVPSAGTGSSGIKITTKYFLHCPCAGQSNCHCSDSNYPHNGGWDFGAAIQDWIFFGGEKVNRWYDYNPSSPSSDLWGMELKVPDCKYGDNGCLAKEGWKNGNPRWIPYTLLSTEKVNNNEAFILIYNENDFLDDLSVPRTTPHIRRMWSAYDDPDNGVKGYVTAPISRLDSLRDSWSDPSKTVIFIGPTKDSVMCHLYYYSNGKYPYFTGPNPCCQSPLSVTASASPTSGSAPLTVNFTSSASGGSGGYTYTWTFGDGTTGSGSATSHTYQTAGNYSAYVTVKDSSNNSATSSQIQISVSQTQGLNCTISASPTSGTAPLTVNFSATVSGGISPYSYSWNFGDGGSSTFQNPAHTFQNSGAYNVVLTVTDSTTPTHLSTSKNITINVSASGVYSISGTVRTYNGYGLSGVTVKAGIYSALTNSPGNYTISSLPNGTYSVSPSLRGYTFLPENISVTINGANATGNDFTADRPLTSGTAVSGSVSLNQWKYYSISVNKLDKLTVTLTNLSSNVDLYLKVPSNGSAAAHPTTNSYSYSSTNSGTTNETISVFLSPSSYGTASIGVYGRSSASYQIKAVIESGNNPTTSLVEGKIVNSSENGISDIKFKIGGTGTESDSSGYFVFYDLPAGDYTLEPSDEDRAKYTFDPPNRKIHIDGNGDQHKGENFKATKKR